MKETGLKCEDCGNMCGEDTFYPYAEEINDEQIPVCLCPDCYHERCMDT